MRWIGCQLRNSTNGWNFHRTIPTPCESFLRQHVLEPLQIRADRYIGFDNQATDTLAECRRIETELQNSGGIDIAILGIGINGHIGLNEPAAYLQAGCHVADLTPTTVGHSMLEGTADRVTPRPHDGRA